MQNITFLLSFTQRQSHDHHLNLAQLCVLVDFRQDDLIQDQNNYLFELLLHSCLLRNSSPLNNRRLVLVEHDTTTIR